MKIKLTTLFLIITVITHAQYSLGKNEKEIRLHYDAENGTVERSVIDDTTFLLTASTKFYNCYHYMDSRKDSCTIELVTFNQLSFQELYMKDLNKRLIPIETNKWKTYLYGRMVFALFRSIDKIDSVMYFFKN